MKNYRNKKILQTSLFVLIAVVTLGIGYASITAINLIINGNATASVNQENFVVHFVSAENITGSTGVGGTTTYDGITAEFNVTGLSKVGDYAIAKYKVRNDSTAIGTEITLEVSSSNPEYFKITNTINNNKLQAGEETYAIVRVEMIKTPIEDDVTTAITAKLKATPIDNATAINSVLDSVISKAYIYSINSSSQSNTIGQEPQGRQYGTFNAAKTAFGHPVANAYVLNNGVISELYSVFEKDGQVYYLRGGISETTDNRPIYNSNIQTLKEAYGSDWESYCNETVDNTGYRSFSCIKDNFQQTITVSGTANVNVPYPSAWYCSVSGTSSYCFPQVNS